MCCHANAQKKNFNYNFYGFVRGDLYYNSRNNIESVDGLFYLYPADKRPDAEGKDLNATSNGSFYTFTTRLGLNIKGPDIGTAKTSAKIESDFGGTTNINFMLRIRQAYLTLDWPGGSSLTLGQGWHPLFGEVLPDILNLSTGSPFQPFNRSPQIKYQYKTNGLIFTSSALYQLIYTSEGPDGKSEKYQKNGVLPEIYLGADYEKGNFLVGAGVDMLSLKPRLQAVQDDKIFRVNERVTSFSYDLHAKYTCRKLRLSGKTLLASNQTHNVMIGGFGVTRINDRTGEQEYVPFRHSTSWFNATYGTTYQGGFFAGYTKNLGTSESLVSTDKLYGSGLNIDQFVNLSVFFRYALPHWNIGLEYTLATARYGETDLRDGKSKNTHDVSNHRIESVFIYTF
ncbi:MAG: hypothetical protein LBH77_00010 [Tannerella sp.]|nr:hypothetical protein [Tannerella sp.]